jgi:hypothetical protein
VPLGPRMGRPVAACALLVLAVVAGADEGPIQDNSFLIEEAYNQEFGVVQHISAFTLFRPSGDWIYTFTQEWPVPGEKHQLSFTLPAQDVHGPGAASLGIGDVALNYRYQAKGDGQAHVAMAPRFSVLVPTGRAKENLGAGGVGLQLSLPVSVTLGARVVAHTNAGYTHEFSARNAAGDRANTNSYNLGQSFVWLTKPRLNLLVETVWIRTAAVSGPGETTHSNSFLVSPGLRWAYNFVSGLQIVPGLAFPIGVGPSRGQTALFAYLSFEHPFRSKH